MYRIIWPTVDLPRRLKRVFRTPTHKRWERVSGAPQARSIWQDAQGQWQSGIPSVEDVSAAQVIYHGGRDYDLTAAEATVLRDAGFDTTIPEPGFTSLVGTGF